MTTPTACPPRNPNDAVPPLGPERPVAWPQAHRSHALERPAGRARRIAHVPENFRAAFFPQRQCQSSRISAPGLAEMTATVVRTGTASRTSRQIEEDLAPHGRRSRHARGRGHQRDFHFRPRRIFRRHLLELVADLARNASFPEDEFERERRQQIRRAAHRAHHARRFSPANACAACSSAQHPYAIIAPTEEQVAAYQREQLEEFYRQHYRAVRTRC